MENKKARSHTLKSTANEWNWIGKTEKEDSIETETLHNENERGKYGIVALLNAVNCNLLNKIATPSS